MSYLEAMQILDAVRDGEDYPEATVLRALVQTGDMPHPQWASQRPNLENSKCS